MTIVPAAVFAPVGRGEQRYDGDASPVLQLAVNLVGIVFTAAFRLMTSTSAIAWQAAGSRHTAAMNRRQWRRHLPGAHRWSAS